MHRCDEYGICILSKLVCDSFYSWYVGVFHAQDGLWEAFWGSSIEEGGTFEKLTKREFYLDIISFQGHISSREGVSVDPEMVETMKDWFIPKLVTETKNILGLTCCYRKFVQDYSNIAKS